MLAARQSVLTMALSHRLTRWVGGRGAGQCGSKTGPEGCQRSELQAAAPIMMSQKDGPALKASGYEQAFPLLVLTELVKLKAGQ